MTVNVATELITIAEEWSFRVHDVRLALMKDVFVNRRRDTSSFYIYGWDSVWNKM